MILTAVNSARTVRGGRAQPGLRDPAVDSRCRSADGDGDGRRDRYLRMLLTHEARSVLRAASAARELGGSLDGLRTWATAVRGRTNHNKAACAPANKMARICYATLRDATPYGQPAPRQQRKIERLAGAVAA